MFKFNYEKNTMNNEQDDLISIIVPIYNTEKQLKKTIRSILNQTYKNIEVILIDDCSKDKSFSICKKYAKKDNRIRLFRNLENRGVSRTRNVGLSKASGNYIAFVDSDDYIEKDMYEEMIKAIKINDSDLAQCSTFGFHKTELDDNADRIFFKGNKEVYHAFMIWNYLDNMLWDKLFKKSAIGEIRFKDDWKICEDSFFVTETMNNVNNACIVSKSLYHYVRDPETGLSNDFNLKWIKNCFELNNYKEKVVKSKYPDFINDFYMFKLCELSDYTLYNLLHKCKIKESDNKDFKLDFLLDIKNFFETAINVVNKLEKDSHYYNHLHLIKYEVEEYVNKNIAFYKKLNDTEYVQNLEKYLYIFKSIPLDI